MDDHTMSPADVSQLRSNLKYIREHSLTFSPLEVALMDEAMEEKEGL